MGYASENQQVFEGKVGNGDEKVEAEVRGVIREAKGSGAEEGDDRVETRELEIKESWRNRWKY